MSTTATQPPAGGGSFPLAPRPLSPGISIPVTSTPSAKEARPLQSPVTLSLSERRVPEASGYGKANTFMNLSSKTGTDLRHTALFREAGADNLPCAGECEAAFACALHVLMLCFSCK
ncbi:hypothetical protein QQF64_013058 [Cirrhinus molitorella]|uniref:Uncharacterized protein n=1 Tax=Cirrhinus molitorella TaxID=172907 RepID=A0ABR3LTR1_9TELE